MQPIDFHRILLLVLLIFGPRASLALDLMSKCGPNRIFADILVYVHKKDKSEIKMYVATSLICQ